LINQIDKKTRGKEREEFLLGGGSLFFYVQNYSWLPRGCSAGHAVALLATRLLC